MRRIAVMAAVAFVLAVCLSLPASAVTYTITDLGTLGGDFCDASAINELGQVVGRTSVTTDPPLRGYIWGPNSGMSELGALPPAYSQSYARDINDSGLVVGEVMSSNGWQAVYWQDGTAIEMMPNSYSSMATGVNNSGQVAGILYGTDPMYRAFVWQEGTTTILPGLGGANSMAYEVNDSGHVAGWVSLADGTDRAVVWVNNQPIDLGVNGTANGLNNKGQVTGNLLVSGEWYAYLWENNKVTELGTLPGFLGNDAEAINDAGQVVGTAVSSSRYHAFIWEDGVMSDLNDLISADSGWVLTRAKDINESGQIVGWGELNGQSRAFLLNPVPEPSSILALAGGIIGLSGTAWRRRSHRS